MANTESQPEQPQDGGTQTKQAQQPAPGMQSSSQSMQGSPQSMQRRGGAGLARPEQDWPFSFMQRFMRDMDRVFEDFGLGRATSPWVEREAGMPTLWSPRMDVSTREGQLLVHVDLPGMRQEDINVSLENGMLTISGERADEHQRDERGVYRRERSYGSFRRSIGLPESVDPAGVQATFENGVLEVTVPLPSQQAKSRSVPIQSKPGKAEVQH